MDPPTLSKMIFSDVEKFSFIGTDSFHYYRHEIRKEEWLMSGMQNNEIEVMVWDAFHKDGISVWYLF